jgi:D-alanyl-D-alanine carboxypeptidase
MKQILSFAVLFIHAVFAFSQTNLLHESLLPFKMRTENQGLAFKQPVLNSTLAEALDKAFDSITALTPIKGFNAAMLLPDGSVWKRARGLAQGIPTQEALTTDHLMGMGSISKSFVATTMLLLHEDGLLHLDDSIGQYVGPYPNVPGNVTIRQLLSHRSGIGDYLNENPAMSQAWLNNLDSIWVADTILNYYVPAPNFPVGTDWSYSNTNFMLAGRIIETITGQPWYVVLRARVLEPLGLTHTFVYPWETPDNQPFAHVWADLDDNGSVEDLQGLGVPDAGLFSMANSGGCLISTPEDLARFSERVYGDHFLQAATLAEMETDYIQSPAAGKYGLGTASFLFPQQIENWGHNGDLIYKSIALYFPTENLAFALQQNDDRENDPTASNPVLDAYDVYLYLLDTYLNYAAPSATHEITDAAQSLSVFPNPVGTSFQLKFIENAHPVYPLRLVLSDITGKTVLSQTVENEGDAISVGQLPAGVYRLRAGAFSGKIVRQ